MPIGAIGAALPTGMTTSVMPTAAVAPTGGLGTTGASSDVGSSFAAQLAGGLEQVQALQQNADGLAVQAATGDLVDVHNYTIAATQASLATELTVALRNKGVEAFTEIMRMQV